MDELLTAAHNRPDWRRISMPSSLIYLNGRPVKGIMMMVMRAVMIVMLLLLLMMTTMMMVMTIMMMVLIMYVD
ncbi:hypothetical protein DPMN_010612 [Dreissena polymorpha]|uniref:Uncharacterized protein n=1 Tax=Dreissena polymorpha TaxID=45954 RepID=A0A9D4N2K9_DREPO|nr:hypothetical protein DPMN_010612 [Dreissena polymorpha]